MLKNKKAQTEVISDVVAFILILILSIVLIAITQLSVISKLIQSPTDLVSEKGTFAVIDDRLTFYLNSKLQEKRGVTTFSDLIRANDETAKKELANIEGLTPPQDSKEPVIVPPIELDETLPDETIPTPAQ